MQSRPLVVLDHPAIDRFDARCEAFMTPLRRSSLANRVFYASSESANHSMVWHALTWILVATRRMSLRQGVAASTVLIVESGIVNGPIKMLFLRKRPTFEGSRPHRLRTPRTSSFPSGHASSATIATMMLAPFLPWRALRLVLEAFAGTVALSRVHVRIHHCSDVAGGLVVGRILGTVARRIVRAIPR